jgi:hypothetical protein
MQSVLIFTQLILEVVLLMNVVNHEIEERVGIECS